ncbi:MAG: hypothetical protein KDD41_05160 [Flavobacteriales bacterium]|nr:hypothetical protein [Flavobacteriales bacterium]
MKKLVILCLLLTTIAAHSQESIVKNKGRFYWFWGWNRAWYSDSDIHFTGDDYDFTLNDMWATDRQTPFNVDPYFSFTRVTLPQTNTRIGYFINDHIDISIGVDHMKYVLVYNQETEIDGYIHDGTEYDGDYNHEDFVNSYGFLKYEHTDGLNYIHAEINRNDNLFEAFKVNVNPKKLQLNSIFGFGIGALMPKSNVNLWNNERHDAFHFAGYGFSGSTGLDLIIYKYFFLRGQYKVGFIDMPDIRTSSDPSDRASQHFFFNEFFFAFGITYNPFEKSE